MKKVSRMSEPLERDISRRIKKVEGLKAQITELQKQVHEESIYIEGQQSALKLMSRPAASSVQLRKGSDVEKVRGLLLTVETPLHADVILQKIGKPPSAKPSLVGSLNAYANDGKIFTKPAPNTFGLLEKDYANVG